tara:strand:+ start:2574 stop:2834 length:261 start_codon:yes stop_codon:yes gene_type:complete
VISHLDRSSVEESSEDFSILGLTSLMLVYIFRKENKIWCVELVPRLMGAFFFFTPQLTDQLGRNSDELLLVFRNIREIEKEEDCNP